MSDEAKGGQNGHEAALLPPFDFIHLVSNVNCMHLCATSPIFFKFA